MGTDKVHHTVSILYKCPLAIILSSSKTRYVSDILHVAYLNNFLYVLTLSKWINLFDILFVWV